MAEAAVRGSASLFAIGGSASGSGSGMLDLSTPAGWHSVLWWGSVAIIVFFLWAL